MAKDELRVLPINQIGTPEKSLRKVKRDTQKYLELVDSVRVVGVLQPILVRENKNSENGTKWTLIDGMQRFTASIDAGLEVIPALIKTADAVEQLEFQMIANLHKIETLPAEYAKQMYELLLLNPTMTIADQAIRLGKSEETVKKMLGLNNLTEDIKELVDSKQINVTNAYQLAVLPPEEQADWVSSAMTMTPAQFIPLASQRAKDIKDARKQGRTAVDSKEWMPPAFLQSKKDIEIEYKSLQNMRGLLHQFKITDPLDATKMALAWTLHRDPINIEILRQREQERKRLAKVSKEKKKAERDAKSKEEAELVAAGLNGPDDFDLDSEE